MYKKLNPQKGQRWISPESKSNPQLLHGQILCRCPTTDSSKWLGYSNYYFSGIVHIESIEKLVIIAKT